MARSRRNPWIHAGCLGVAVLVLTALAPARGANQARDELIRQQEQQKQVQADTDRMVRQMQTTLRVLQYYKLDKSQEKELLDEAVQPLGKLSANQMSEVITRL